MVISTNYMTSDMSPNKSGVATKRYYCLPLLSITLMLVSGCALDSPSMTTTHKILEPWMDISGAQAGRSRFDQPSLIKPQIANRITLRHPTALSAQGNDIYLYDAGQSRILRYDRSQQTLIPFAMSLPAEAGVSIYAAPDTSVYVTDPSRERVLHFTRDGSQLATLSSRGNLTRPIAVTVNSNNGQIFVADGFYEQIIVFNNFGAAVAVFKPQGVQAIAAMAAGPDGIYVVDRLAKQVVVVGWDGQFRYTFGRNAMSEPGNIAVSRDNLVFVSDNFTNNIKAYHIQRAENSNQAVNENISLVDKIGSFGVTLGRFNGIAGLSVADDLLFVSDSLNARIQVMLINPSALGAGKQE